MANVYRRRRSIFVIFLLLFIIFAIFANTPIQTQNITKNNNSNINKSNVLAIDELKKLKIKNRVSNDNYSREQFGNGWATISGCDMRNIILNRDLEKPVVNDKCDVTSGTLQDPYTGKIIEFVRGDKTSGDVQIDHVVALSDAWQKGAQLLNLDTRKELANDPLELLAVDGDANMKKSNSDASEWLPANKAFRCPYIARQIAVKSKYNLWVTKNESDVMLKNLSTCPNQLLPAP